MRMISIAGVTLLLGACGQKTPSTTATATSTASTTPAQPSPRRVLIDGKEAIPDGTRFDGHLTAEKASGHLKGRAVLGLRLDSFTIDGDVYPIDTVVDQRVSARPRKRNFAFIGAGAATGAGIGALAGGGVWAAIGAGAGARAGATTAFFTGKKNVAIAAETVLTFRLREPVTVGE